MTHTQTHTHEAYTQAGWTPCRLIRNRTKYRKVKNGDRIDRVIKHVFVQLFPAMNVVKRLPTSVREV
jgi:hypothetical protein